VQGKGPEDKLMANTKSPLNWEREGGDWPNRQASLFVNVAGLDWHVQEFGEGPSALLIHGTGASTHSWSWLAPHLSGRFRLILIDLPSHAFTSAVPSSRMTLPEMSSAVGSLLKALGASPILGIGHSAGAAILLRMTLDNHFTPQSIVSINGALMPFPGMARHIFPAMAKMLFLNPLTPRFFAWRAAQTGSVEKLIESTGSQIPADSIAFYRRLLSSADHVAGALSMMANWDLAPLMRDLPNLKPALVQIVGSNDWAVPADQAFQIAQRFSRPQPLVLRGLGHLAHEEDPARVAACLLDAVGIAEPASA
jgi:magnesium chelatase accessory protein